MKRFCTLVFITFLASTQLFAQALEELEKRIAAENHIKTKTQYDHKYVSGKASANGSKTLQTTYNNKGEIILKRTYDSKGNETGSEKYEYDVKGNRTLYERSGNSIYKKINKYNSNNKLSLEAGYNGAENFRNEYTYVQGKLSSIKYVLGTNVQQILKYTHSGSTTTAKVLARGTSHTSTLKMKYDTRGNLIEETTLSVDGKELEKKVFTYNSASLIIEETKTRAGAFDYRLNYSYTTAGYLKSVTEETRAKKKYAKKVYTYDTNNNLVKYEWRRNPDSEFNSKTYTYYPKGVCLSEETYYPKTKFKRLAKFKYTYY